MNKFSKKPSFDPFWVHFPNFGGQKNFSHKILLCHAQLRKGFQHHAKIYKKLIIQFKENTQADRMDRRMEGQTYLTL